MLNRSTRLHTAKVRYYVVQRGDTLSEIGERLGISWRRLAQWNSLRNPALIFPGQLIRVE